MIYYAVARPGEPPRLSTNPQFLNQAEGEFVLQLADWPSGDVVMGEDGTSLVSAQVSLDRLRANRWIEARMYRDDRANGLCATPAGVVQIDDASKLKINGAVNMAMLATQAQQPYAINWTMADNSVAVLNAQGMIGLGLAVGRFVAACQDASTTVRAQIDDAATAEALQAIDITAGYPTVAVLPLTTREGALEGQEDPDTLEGSGTAGKS